jgi:hypothetical protein
VEIRRIIAQGQLRQKMFSRHIYSGVCPTLQLYVRCKAGESWSRPARAKPSAPIGKVISKKRLGVWFKCRVLPSKNKAMSSNPSTTKQSNFLLLWFITITVTTESIKLLENY